MNLHLVPGAMTRVAGAVAVVVVLTVALTSCGPPPALSGTVTRPTTGAPVIGTEVTVFADSAPDQVATTYTDATGHYEVASLVPGTYRIRMSDAVWYSHASKWATATPVVVVSGETTVVDATLFPATGSLSGMVTASGGGPLSGATVVASNAVTGAPIASRTTGAAGTYSFAALPTAPYKVSFARSGYGTVFYNGAAGSSSATPVAVTTGGSLAGVDAVLDVAAQLAGTVTNGHVGLGGLQVQAYVGADAVGSGVTASNGTFTIGALPAGDYKLLVGDLSGNHRAEFWGTTGTDPAPSPAFSATSGVTLAVGTDVVAGADCDPAVFLPGASLVGEDLHGLRLDGCALSGADLEDSDLSGADLEGATLAAASLPAADLAGADLSGADLSDSDLTEADLTAAVFDLANLTGATVAGADFTDALGLSTTTGLASTATNGWTDTDFTAANLVLVDADLAGADLSGVILRNANVLAGVDLTDADLSDSDLRQSIIYGAVLTRTDLSGADLRDANLFFSIGDPVGFTTAIYGHTFCPTGVFSDDVGGTCGGEPWMCLAPTCLAADHCPSITPEVWWGATEHESVDFAGVLGDVRGTVFRPADTDTYPGARPLVVIEPGYNLPECYQWWLAWSLAGHGYTTIAITPTYPISAEPDFVAAIDFMDSPANPYEAETDASHIGLAGHSSGADLAQSIQSSDPRVDAIVALDELKPDYPAVVPALGISSEQWFGAGPPPGPVDGKLAGFDHWKDAEVPTGTLVMEGTVHGDFFGSASTVYHERFWFATQAWFDRWLDGDLTALDPIESPTWLGVARSTILSDYYTSAMAAPEYTCLDLTTC